MAEAIERLPDHLLLHCLCRLSASHQALARLVCRRFRNLLAWETVLRYRRDSNLLSPWLCVIGGVHENKDLVAEMYDCIEERWRPMPKSPPNSSFNFSCVVLNERLYTVGGFMGWTGIPSKMGVYNPTTNCWEDAAQMRDLREAFACGAIGGCIYVAGGLCRRYCQKENARVNTAEVYIPEEDCWYPSASMNVSRSCCGSAVVEGKLYAIGGYGVQSVLKSVEVFDPRSQLWTFCQEIPDFWIIAGCAAIGHMIYVIGSNILNMNQLELAIYDTWRDNWLVKGTVPRYLRLQGYAGSGVASMNGKLYVVGGASLSDGGALRSALIYDPVKDTWSTLKQMLSRRHGCAAAVIYL